ncbi:MAG TPA: hypothetical protein VGM10_14720 [Actinocrinis sp.]
MDSASAVCRCGHPGSAHEHYRPGSECAVCGLEVCSRFRRRPWWDRLRARRIPAPGDGE